MKVQVQHGIFLAFTLGGMASARQVRLDPRGGEFQHGPGGDQIIQWRSAIPGADPRPTTTAPGASSRLFDGVPLSRMMDDTCDGDVGGWWAKDPYAVFIDHFSAQRTSTEAYLYDQMRHLYPNTSVVITQDRFFNVLGYSASGAAQGSIVMRPMKDIEKISKIVYGPAQRRRDGDGRVGEAVTFAGYEIGWKNYEFKAIVASWMEGYNTVTQWHLIGENQQVAEELIHTVAAWSSKLREVVLVFDNGFWMPDHNLWLAIQSASWKDVILAEELKKKVQHDYRSFFRSEKIYKDLNVPWKRGLIFLGPPGNGKTVSLKAIMKEVDVPILYVKSFRTYMGDEMGIREIFVRARQEAPCVLVMEDLDSLITDQNRSFFLNEVDGLEDNDGLLLIGTTNHFDRLDPALSNRPSRFDRKYNFPNPDRDERRAYAVYWQKKLASNKEIDFPDSLLDEVADQTDKFSFAYLKEAFVSTLLTLAGREDAPEELVQLPFRDILLEQIKTLKESLESGNDILGLEASWQPEQDEFGGEIFGGGGFRRLKKLRGGSGQPSVTRSAVPVATSSLMPPGASKICVAYRDDGNGGMTRIPAGEAVPTGGVELTGEELDKALKKMDAAIKAEEEATGTSFVIQE